MVGSTWARRLLGFDRRILPLKGEKKVELPYIYIFQAKHFILCSCANFVSHAANQGRCLYVRSSVESLLDCAMN